MQQLNLPAFDARVKETGGKASIYDPLRRRYVALTPEEWVRQHFVHFLIAFRRYPATLLANEVTLRIGEKTLRADTVLVDKHLRPRMIIEYKAPSVNINERVLQQITAYNTLLHVDCLVVSNGLTHLAWRPAEPGQTPVFLPDIPFYEAL
ncbi:MAG: type I restriction enzyme HsdR N-terminal domain-containing protein [Prevotella sp.]|nr:type I restriction enzyme HsdR N-terminal domain-containing protein [Prevotella sp.]